MTNENQSISWGPLALVAGLSILSNNDGRMNTGQLIARGGLDALGAYQARREYEAAMQRQNAKDEREAQEWQWKVDDRNRQRSLMERFAAGDEDAMRILYPEQYFMNKRQEAAHKHALNVLRLEKLKNGAQGGAAVPAFVPVDGGAATTATPTPSPVAAPVPSPAGPMTSPPLPSPAQPSAGGADSPSVFPIPAIPAELRAKIKPYLRSVPSHPATNTPTMRNPETGEGNPMKELPRQEEKNPAPSTSAGRVTGGAGFEGGHIYDLNGNEVRATGPVKWGKQGEIQLPDGRKVVGQFDNSGNYFRYAGEAEKAAGKALAQGTVENITNNFGLLGRIRGAGETARSNPSATGPVKGFINDRLPDALLQWFDPDGTVSRAKIAELSSAVIHDRSGAAVTAAEFPRLRPFIPQIGDTPDTVQKKLKGFYEVVQEETNLYLESLRASGYEVPEIMFERGNAPFSAEEGNAKLDEIWNGGR